jgi:Cu-Zn family superoxide dismutase
MHTRTIVVLAGMIVLLAGSTGAMALADTGIAHIRGTAPGSSITGTVLFEDRPGGLWIRAELENMDPGEHGFHIHEYGLVTNGGKDAGGHFNPRGNPHGHVLRDGIEDAHAGDLGNIRIGPDRSGTLELVVPGLSLSSGPSSVAGRAVIVHQKADDFGQPTGNAGGRIAAGTIVIGGAGSAHR